jgi:hypothetical protein
MTKSFNDTFSEHILIIKWYMTVPFLLLLECVSYAQISGIGLSVWDAVLPDALGFQWHLPRKASRDFLSTHCSHHPITLSSLTLPQITGLSAYRTWCISSIRKWTPWGQELCPLSSLVLTQCTGQGWHPVTIC